MWINRGVQNFSFVSPKVRFIHAHIPSTFHIFCIQNLVARERLLWSQKFLVLWLPKVGLPSNFCLVNFSLGGTVEAAEPPRPLNHATSQFLASRPGPPDIMSSSGKNFYFTNPMCTTTFAFKYFLLLTFSDAFAAHTHIQLFTYIYIDRWPFFGIQNLVARERVLRSQKF